MRSFVWVAVLLAAIAAYVVLFPPVNLALGRGLLRSCPVRFGEWSGAELSFEDAVVDELRADDLLLRRYQRGTDVIWLMIVYHQNARNRAHDPVVCYDSEGYAVGRTTPAVVTGPDGRPVEINAFWAERPRDRRLVYFWWYAQGQATGSRGEAQGLMALRGALDNRSWGALVRVETLAPAGADARATADLKAFAAEVMRALPGLFASEANDKERS
jgi:EpsI family protein